MIRSAPARRFSRPSRWRGSTRLETRAMNPAPMPAITALYAALIAILLLILGLRVMLGRRTHHVGIGDGGNATLHQAVRVHANAVEWALPVLILMLVAELNRATPVLLHVT